MASTKVKEHEIIYIYSLVDPRNNKPRYIGKTNNLKIRLSGHLRPSQLKKNSHKNQWIKQLLFLNLKPIMCLLEMASKIDYIEKEKYWISFYGRENLTNGTDGGEGCENPSKETRKKHSDVQLGEKNSFYGKHHTLETKQKIKESIKGKSHTAETRRKISDKHRKSGSRHIGLKYVKTRDHWMVRINENGFRYFLGTFKYETEAAMAWNDAMLDCYGWKVKENLNQISQEEIDKLWEME